MALFGGFGIPGGGAPTFNTGPSGNVMDRIRQKSRGNTGVTGGMGAQRAKAEYRRQPMPPPMQRNPTNGGGFLPMPNIPPNFRGGWGHSSPGQDGTFGGRVGLSNEGPPVSTTMPVGRPRPNIQVQPQEGVDLWRSFNRMLGGPSTLGARLY